MFRIFKWSAALTTTAATLHFTVLTKQQRQNVYGAYRSVINSSKAAMILYKAVKDYEISLKDIPYNTQQYHQIRHEVHLRVANSILQLSKSNRGIYLKLGQYLGNLDKVVPREFTDVLKVLQDSAPPIDFQELNVVIENDLGRQSSDLFVIDTKAIASASLAQVHKAILKQNGKEVALKVQYPFLKIQSKWDLLVLRKITEFCNYLIKKHKNNDFDFIKLYQTWTSTLVQELDFTIQLQHALKTKQLFKNHPYIYIPQYYTNLCSDRLLVMQFIEGIKINQCQQIQAIGIDPIKVANNLIDIFTTMIYTHGFVHCDAHPGNIFVRKQNNVLGHDIVLLDHGLYRSISKQTIRNFSGMWVNLMIQDKAKVQQYAYALNIHNHYEYLPLIFLQRATNSNKKIGDEFTQQQKDYFRQKDMANFDTINQILQDLPPELMYIIRASNLVGSHNLALGNTNRNRFFTYTQRSIRILFPGVLGYYWHYYVMLARIWMFQNYYSLYKRVFGTLEN